MSEHERDCKTADFIVCDDEVVSEDNSSEAVCTAPVPVPECLSVEPDTDSAPVDASVLARYKSGFTRQGLLWLIGWGMAWVIPALTTAHWIPGMFGESRFFVLVPLLSVIAVPASVMGLIALLAGRGYVRRAQQLCTDGEAVSCRMELKLRPKRESIYGSTLCDAVMTYPDGRTETIKLLARDMDISPLLGDPIAKVALIGSPFSSSEPRVVATPYGELLEQPDIGQAWNGMLSLFRSPGDRRHPAIEREYQRSIGMVAYCLIFWPIWAMLIPASLQSMVWWFVPTFVASVAYGGLRVAIAWQARRMAKVRRPALCTVVSQPANWGERIANKVTMIVTGEGHERRETMCGYVPQKFDGQVLEAQVWYKDGAPWMVAAKDFVLFKHDKLRRYALLPIILYIGAMPFIFSGHTSSATKSAPVVASSAQEYYQKGLDYKAYGWTEKAREALMLAAKADPGGAVGHKALTFLHSHIPAYPVAPEAEELNIEAYNLSYSHETDRAKVIWKDLILKYPNFEWPYSNLASELLSEGHAAEAVPLLEQALRINPNYTNALHHMFVAQSQLNNRDAAIEYLRRCAASDPDNFALQSELFAVERSI